MPTTLGATPLADPLVASDEVGGTAVYDASLATFETSGGLFSQQASPGFIEIWSLQSRMAHRLRNG